MNALKTESRAYFQALGEFISVLRKEHGMTQAELARAIGVSQQTVYAYELGDRRVSLLALMKLSKVLDLPVDQLMGMGKAAVPRRPRRISPAGERLAADWQRLRKTRQRFIKRIVQVMLAEEAPDSES